MTDMKIERHDNATKGRYTIEISGIDGEAELTFSKASDRLIIVDHTGVPDSMRGMGAGKALAERMIADARAAGQKIVPLCPFFKSYADRHSLETADVIN